MGAQSPQQAPASLSDPHKTTPLTNWLSFKIDRVGRAGCPSSEEARGCRGEIEGMHSHQRPVGGALMKINAHTVQLRSCRAAPAPIIHKSLS